MPKLHHGLAALAFLLPALALASSPLDEAQRLIEIGRYTAASGVIERHLAGHPDDYRGQLLQALALAGNGQTGEAMNRYRQLIDRHPERPEAYNNLAVLQAAAGQFEAARESLLGALNSHPAYAQAHANLNRLFAALASEAYAQVLEERNPGNRSRPALELALIKQADTASAPPIIVAAPAPLPAAPVPPTPSEPVETPFDPSVARAEVATAVQAWATAWSRQQVDAYLARYAAAFIPPDGASRRDWEALRRLRIEAPAFIEVIPEGLEIELFSPTLARADFLQRYRSNTFSSNERKSLLLTRGDAGWQIVVEQIR